MKRTIQYLFFSLLALNVASCARKEKGEEVQKVQDKPFVQDYSIKYRVTEPGIQLKKVVCDRNGYVQVMSSNGLLRLRDGQFLFPGTLVKDVQDRPTSDKKIAGIGIYQDQIIYIDNKAILSNAWAGKLYDFHNLPNANLFAGGKNFAFMISDGKCSIFCTNRRNCGRETLPPSGCGIYSTMPSIICFGSLEMSQ